MGADLEDKFTFYASYHHNKANQFIHIVCVWPILITALIFLAYTPSLNGYVPESVLQWIPQNVKLDISLLFAIRYILFYATVEQPGIAGLIAAALVLWGYFYAQETVASNPAAWKPALIVHVLCWIAQFVGHGIFEKRAPALIDNFGQAVIMAPLFVLMEVLFLFGYKSQFRERVESRAVENIKKFNQKSK